MAKIPERSVFPPGTRFVVLEFDVPLACVPREGHGGEWFNWFGGTPRPYPPERLKPGNHWPAATFEEWAGLVAASQPLRG